MIVRLYSAATALRRLAHLSLAASLLLVCAPHRLPAQSAPPAHLSTELSADDILNGKYPFPPSPSVEAHDDFSGFAKDRLSPVPAPGIHPRILFSPEDLPALRARLRDTEVGRKLTLRFHQRLAAAIGKPGTQGNLFYEALATGNVAAATKILNENHGVLPGIGHYQPYIYALAMESFDDLLNDDQVRGRRVATAIATWAKIIDPVIDSIDKQPMYDDVSRAFAPKSNDWTNSISIRDLVGYHVLGYAYDFAYNFMTPAQRDQVRHEISRVTYGRLWMGARLPHHFRNWNWIAIGLSQPLLALAIEGEPGYDPRVYKLGVQIARDYLTYAISPTGESTEAVGYTNFGFVWATPFWVAAARRGEDFLVQSHNRHMIDWYLQTEEPYGRVWQSHGDGGDSGPSIWNMSMWKYFYPNDPTVDHLWQDTLFADNKDQLKDATFHIVEPMIFAADPGKDAANRPLDSTPAKLNAPLAMFDPVRSSVNARNNWAPDATSIEFECRTDSVGPSHEHADRGNFTLSAMGRQWAKESFRSIESRHHNVILIDGLGQGYWPGPGRWDGYRDNGWALMAAADAKPAYDTWWPKEVVTEAPDWERYQYFRWATFLDQEKIFTENYDTKTAVRDPRPSVVAHFKDFQATGPRMWDEDTWPLAFPHNPVQRAFRTVTFVRGDKPYLLVTDDIQKDAGERLYEWLMMTGTNTDIVSIEGNNILLADATAPRNAEGLIKPKKGDRELLVRVLDIAAAAHPHDYQARPSFRLETFEKKDTNDGDGVGYGMGRSFGTDRRLVVATRAAAPNFKILLLPTRAGDPLPVTAWNADHTQLTITLDGHTDTFTFTMGTDGRNRIVASRPGQPTLTLP